MVVDSKALDLSCMRPLPAPYLRHQLSLYVHYPFCVHKCPYCDFASEAQGANEARDELYLELLIKEWRLKLPLWAHTGRKLCSLYIGGGTPSLCSAANWEKLIREAAPFLDTDAEICLEANPGTLNLERLQALHAAGFNRISIGVQSFNDAALKRLGRIHNSAEAIEACELAKKAGFTNFNIDLMHGLPCQNAEEALADLKQALALDCTHLSWYELTLEEGTYFGKHPPRLPDEDVLLEIEERGWDFLAREGFEHYEVSGYNQGGEYRCRHNLNYWLYGDYLGLGAAAHQKLSFIKGTPESSWGELWQHPERLQSARDVLTDHNDSLFTITRSANPEDFATYQQQCLAASTPLAWQQIEQTQAHEVGAGRALEIESHDSDGESYEIPAEVGGLHKVEVDAIPFEFMLNRMRLERESISPLEYLCHTGLSLSALRPQLEELQRDGLIKLEPDLTFAVTPRGKLMLNDAICAFLCVQ